MTFTQISNILYVAVEGNDYKDFDGKVLDISDEDKMDNYFVLYPTRSVAFFVSDETDGYVESYFRGFRFQ